ncbi:MAG: hypothetical protein Q9169_008672 [Polycauliona sp. 2 TL-2023]
MQPHSNTPFLTLILTLLLLFHLTPTTTAQGTGTGTITLALATSNDESAASASIPFNTLSTKTFPKAVSIHANSGTGISIPQSAIRCQCFSDAAGKQALGESFGTDFPGALLGAEPVGIGSIFCGDEEGVGRQMEGVKAAEKVEVEAFRPSTTKTAGAGATTTATTGAGAGAEEVGDGEGKETTVQLRFALSTDPSDDTSTQMPVAFDAIVAFSPDNPKPVFSVEATSMGGGKEGGDGLVCQAFRDAKAKEPLEAGFGLEEERVLGGGVLVDVEAVGCMMLGSAGFGGLRGLIGMGS